MKRTFILLAIVLLVVIADYSYGQGCSQCKLVAEQGSELEEASFGTNINYGILYLMILPYVVLFFVFRKPLVKFLRTKLSKP